MTEREREIFNIIKQNPAIEQSEIAAKLNIARSSVGVHIANLQKKGYILGKGYIVNKSDYVCGVGAANVDIHGRSRKEILMRDSNPGFMNSSTGGVTRNVCENLARLGDDAKLISAVGNDVYADKIRKDCIEAGIDITNIFTAENHPSSTYISILDEKGDMLVALSDMRVLENLTEDFIHSKANIIRGAKVVTCDPSLPYSIIEELLQICRDRTPVFMDPVSSAYATKIKPLVGKFHTVKPNEMELAILSGIPVNNKDDMRKACQILIDQGTRRVFVSCGKEGCYYLDYKGTELSRSFRPIEQMVNATGAGDSFMAGVIHSFVNDYSLDKTIDYALAAGIVSIIHERTINPNISVSLIEKVIKERK